jgi:dCTP deaminase
MGIVGRYELIELIKKYNLIYPFNEQLIDGDGYILTVKNDVILNYLEHKNVISHEIVFTTPYYVAHLTAKSRYGRLGLSFLNAAKIHSGFIGRIVLEVVNLNNERKPITIKKGDPFMHVEFITRDGKPYPYNGEYQFQYMNDEEVKKYMDIIRLEFNDIFDLKYLNDIARKRVL